MLTDRLRGMFKGVLDPAARLLLRLGLTPDSVTLLGLLGHLAAAALAALGYIPWAGVVLLVMAPLDALDGAMARLKGEPSRFGAFFDSVIDRFAEFALFGGLLLYYHQQGRLLPVLLAYLAIVGSIMVSYTRARAESLGLSARIGILSRLERYVVLIPALILDIPLSALWILAIFTNITALQRILHVRKQSRVQPDPARPARTQEKG